MTTRTSRRTRQIRQREAAQLADALTRAQVALTQARSAWGSWADTMRQQAEAAHGTGYIEADPVILNNAQYRDALDLGGELDQALTNVIALMNHLRHTELRAAEAGQWARSCPPPTHTPRITLAADLSSSAR